MNIIEVIESRRQTTMDLAVVYILVAVVAGAMGQILLKQGMGSMGAVTINAGSLVDTLWRMGTNIYVVIGLFVYVSGTIFWLAALSRVDLSYAYPFASLSYVVMLIASWQLFKEDISLLRVVGTLIVGLGVFVISRS